MPNCFQLTRKDRPEEGPVAFHQIDKEMCEFFNEPEDPKYWYVAWYDCIGFRLACGKTFDQIEEEFEKGCRENYIASDQEFMEKQLKVVQWLKERFTSNAWVEIGKR